jgi:hypothetical protein
MYKDMIGGRDGEQLQFYCIVKKWRKDCNNHGDKGLGMVEHIYNSRYIVGLGRRITAQG